jgi:serine/threonine protein kinase
MRLASGQTLGEAARDYHQPIAAASRRERELAWHRLLGSVRSVAEAVAYAHDHGVIHCDLKPGNIVVGEHGETTLLDWGMARLCGSPETALAGPAGIAPQPAIAGTPAYMAPEAVDGLADPRTDVFGLGAVLYEVLTGRSPHGWSDGMPPCDWQSRVREACIERPGKTGPAVPRALATICVRALAREPGDRYQSAAEFADDLRACLALNTCATRRPGWSAKLASLWRRR